MKRNIAILAVFILCVSLFLTGGKQKLISEDEAKAAGLAFINHVFDANETEAVVTKAVQAGTTYVDGEYIHTGNEQNVNYYVVATPTDANGRSDYIVFVNAETGVAYSAEKSYSLVPKMTNLQREKWREAYGTGDAETADFGTLISDCYIYAREWIPQKFDLKAGILGNVDSGSMFDSDGGSSNFYIVIRDGTIYHVTVAWPQMMVIEVTILNQTRPTGDVP
ncbi:MAG: hypothetical protein R2912_03135 [Eubacteriales bacterium]